MQRKTFCREEIAQYYTRKNLNQSWSKLVKKYPSFFTTVWEVNRSELCQQKAMRFAWDQDECHRRLKESILTVHWALGDTLLNELLAIGRNPMMVELMCVREAVLNKDNLSDTVDMQTVVLLTAVKAIGKHQNLDTVDKFVFGLLLELDLKREFLDTVTTKAIAMDILSFS